MSIHKQVKSFTEDIVASYETRKAGVATLARETHQTLNHFQMDRQKTASEQKRSLAANRTKRASQVLKMRARNTSDLKQMSRTLRTSLTNENKARVETVHELLAGFSKEHQAMAGGLRNELSTFQKNLSKTVNGLRREFSFDHRQARTHLNHMAQEMAAKRAGKPAATTEKPVVATHPVAEKSVVATHPVAQKPVVAAHPVAEKPVVAYPAVESAGKKTIGKTDEAK